MKTNRHGPTLKRLVLMLPLCAYVSQIAAQVAAPSDVAKRASRLADEVYVKAQDLTLLEEFYEPRDLSREKIVRSDLDAAMRALEAISTNSRKQAAEGAIPREIAEFSEAETKAARLVIKTQSSLHAYKKEGVKYPLGNSPRLKLISDMYGDLPGPAGTPEFYLKYLTWARKGFPRNRLAEPVKTIEPVLTAKEAQAQKLKQLTNPGNPNKGLLQEQLKANLKANPGLIKNNALKSK